MWNPNNHPVKAFLLLLLIFSASCTFDDKKVDCNDINNITIHFLPKEIDPVMPISDCNYIFKYEPVLKNITINDRDIICELASIINNLKISTEEAYLDFRIMVLIENKNGEINHLCIGENDLIVYDGVLMKNETVLFSIIDKLLY